MKSVNEIMQRVVANAGVVGDGTETEPRPCGFCQREVTWEQSVIVYVMSTTMHVWLHAECMDPARAVMDLNGVSHFPMMDRADIPHG